MEISEEKIRSYVKRLLLSRMRLLASNGFYGLLLMHMEFALDEACETAATDGRKIYFGPAFLDTLSDGELDFVLMHEILHVALQHCFRQGERDNELFNIACDIVVNSNILLSNDMKTESIHLREHGTAMHLAPDGKEGHRYTAEEVYAMLTARGGSSGGSSGGGPNGNGNGQGKGNGQSGNGGGQGKGNGGRGKGASGNGGQGKNGAPASTWDDHSRWGEVSDEMVRDLWVKRFEDACEAMAAREAILGRGMMPAFAKRLLQELKKPQTDWRTILNDFVQEDLVDYSFTPPDRRQDGPFFLPDFNEKEDAVENILFMIDTSASMSDEMVTAAYSEVKGAVDQFDGKLKGYLGFFDAGIVEPRPFVSEESFLEIKPAGGGGTDFGIIFEYVFRYMQDELPASIIILTDGCAPYPNEERAGGISVLWLINNEHETPPWGKIARIKV